MSNGLPRDWKQVCLGDVADEIIERVDNPLESGYDRFVGLEHFESGSLTIKKWGSTKDVTSAMKLFKKGDILFARRNAYLKRSSMADFDGVCSGDAFVLRQKPDVMVDNYLPLIVNTETLWNYAISNAAGSMSKRVKWKDLAKFEFPLPSKPQQKRIAEILWATEDNINIKERLKEVNINLYATVREHLYIRKTFHGINHNIHDTWYSSSLEDVVNQGGGIIQTGPFGTLIHQSDYSNEGIPIIQPQDILPNGTINIDSIKKVNEQTYNRLQNYHVKVGDILLGRRGEIGRRCIITEKEDGWLCGTGCIRIQPGTKLSTLFLYHALGTKHYLNFLIKSSVGSTMVNLRTSKMKEMLFTYPERNKQQKIGQLMNNFYMMESNLQKDISSNVNLKMQLLKDLITGKLLLGGDT